MPFHLYCPELRSEKRGTDPQRSEKCLDYHRSLLSGHFPFWSFLFAKPLMLIFVRPRNGNSEHRYQLFTHRGVLLRNRDFVPVIRILSCHPYAGNVVVLTVVSLGNPSLSYWLAGIPAIGVIGIWWSIPIGWFIADVIGNHIL